MLIASLQYTMVDKSSEQAPSRWRWWATGKAGGCQDAEQGVRTVALDGRGRRLREAGGQLT